MNAEVVTQNRFIVMEVASVGPVGLQYLVKNTG